MLAPAARLPVDGHLNPEVLGVLFAWWEGPRDRRDTLLLAALISWDHDYVVRLQRQVMTCMDVS